MARFPRTEPEVIALSQAIPINREDLPAMAKRTPSSNK